jgi:hypothetical protein
VIIQYARKPGLAHNQRWTYQNGYIYPTSAPHLVLDIRVRKKRRAFFFFFFVYTNEEAHNRVENLKMDIQSI